MQHEPAEAAFHDPTVWKYFEAFEVGVSAYDFDVDAVCDDGCVVSTVHPGLDDAGMGGSESVEDLLATGRVLIGRCGDDDHEKQPERVNRDVPLATLIFLPMSTPWLDSGTLLEVFTLCESMTAALGDSSRLLWTRTPARNVSWIASVVPSTSHKA